jgi:DNA-3-methyladenine glycosylase II
MSKIVWDGRGDAKRSALEAPEDGYNRVMMDRTARVSCPGWIEAQRHLAKADPVMAGIVARVGPCTLAPRTDYFAALCQSIINQQISAAAGASVYRKFRALFPRGKPSPAGLLRVDDVNLRAAGLSRQKALYLRGIARAFADGAIPVRRFRSMEDEALIESLITLKGVGRWTAEVFLMFVLGRQDMLPVDDLGLRVAMQRAYKLRQRPKPEKMREIAKAWRPYRSVASWYLWRSLSADSIANK